MKKQQQDWLEAQTDLRAAYSRLFATRDGRVVLDDLRRRYYDLTIKTDADMHRVVGQRDVVLHILQSLERTDVSKKA